MHIEMILFYYSGREWTARARRGGQAALREQQTDLHHGGDQRFDAAEPWQEPGDQPGQLADGEQAGGAYWPVQGQGRG